MKELQSTIEAGYARQQDGRSAGDETRLKDAVEAAIRLLDSGQARVAERVNGVWQVNQWLKKAVLLSFRLAENRLIEGTHSNFYDKVPLKFAGRSQQEFSAAGIRVVPDAIVRRGAFLEKGVVLMPSYINIGAYIGSGTMVDTWATVGSCAQIGRNVHLSGGAGNRRRTRASAGITHDYRGRLFYRRTFRNCRRCRR